MFIMVAWSGYHGLESIEDQVSADIRNVVQASKSDLMAKGVAIIFSRWPSELARSRSRRIRRSVREGNPPLDRIVEDDRRGHLALQRRHSGTLNESTNVGVKTGGSRVGGPVLCV